MYRMSCLSSWHIFWMFLIRISALRLAISFPPDWCVDSTVKPATPLSSTSFIIRNHPTIRRYITDVVQKASLSSPRINQHGLLIRGCIEKFPNWPPGARTANGTALCHKVQLYRYFVSQSSEFCRHNPLCCFSASVVVYFVIESVWKLLDTPSYIYLTWHWLWGS
jgi:hypothetical protein